MPQSQRLTACFSGNVQGVGFRYTALHIARPLSHLTGYVRNLPDGRVEMVAEGPAEELDLMLNRIRSAMAARISRVDATRAPATAEFTHFTVRY